MADQRQRQCVRVMARLDECYEALERLRPAEGIYSDKLKGKIEDAEAALDDIADMLTNPDGLGEWSAVI